MTSQGSIRPDIPLWCHSMSDVARGSTMVSWHNFGCLSCISVAIIQGIFESPRISCFSIFFQKTYLPAFLAFLLKPCNQETPLGVVCRVKERPNLIRNAGLLAFSSNLNYKRRCFSTFWSKCKHPLNFMCHIHNRQAVELTKIWLKCFYSDAS